MFHSIFTPPVLSPTDRQADVYALTPSQERMWVIYQLNRDSTAYNSPVVRKVDGLIQVSVLKRALHQLLGRHEQLRAVFRLAGERPMLYIQEDSHIPFIHREDVSEEEISELVADFIRPFTLEHGPLIRVGLFSLRGEGGHVLIVDMHHIISDLRSEEVIVYDLFQLYDQAVLPSVPVTYRSYVETLHRRAVEDGVAAVSFWDTQLSEQLPLLEMPTQRARPAVFDFRGSILHFPITGQLTGMLQALADRQQVSLYEVLLSAVYVLLSKYSYQEDIIIGLPHEIRSDLRLDRLVGLFINTLPVRSYPRRSSTFGQLLANVTETVRAVRRYYYHDVGQLVETYCPHRDVSRNPLYDVLFFYQRQQTYHIGALVISPMAFVHHKAEVDLTFGIIERDGVLSFSIEYYAGLFDASAIADMGQHFLQILEVISRDVEIRIGAIPLLPGEVQLAVLAAGEGVITSYPQESITTLFDMQVRRQPMHPALVYCGEQLTYAEVGERVASLASVLRNGGLGAGDVAGILALPSFDMVIAILAVLRAGAAYLALDPEYPWERIQVMLADSGSKVLVAQEELSGLAAAFGLDTIYTGQVDRAVAAAEGPLLPGDALRPAYIAYTSGSSGQPKGIVITHRNVIRTVRDVNYIDITATDKLLQLSTYVFDASVFEIFGALLNGATLVIADRDVRRDLSLLEPLITATGVTVAFMTTALFNVMVDNRPGALFPLRKLLTGGEQVSLRHMQSALSYLGSGKLLHMYGPAESTVYASYYPVDEIGAGDHTVPIGYPLANTQLYILNGTTVVPDGIAGELCIGGDGVASGYIHPQLMKERFVTIPLLPGKLLYRTGDIVKRDARGRLIFIRREDSQVKIRGYRIEPDEVLFALRGHPEVRDGVVSVLKTSAGDLYLHAFYLTDTAVAIPDTLLRTYLRDRLPEFMVPIGYTHLQELPQTPNGKIDHSRLAALVTKEDKAEVVHSPAVTMLEKQVAAIWAELLQLKSIDVHRHFFACGGHSLTATVLSVRLQQYFQVTFPVSEVFQYPTIARMAARIAVYQQEVGDKDKIPRSRKQKYYTLSFPERMVYVHQNSTRQNHSYHSIFPMMITGVLDKDRLEEALNELIQRHEILRSGYLLKDGVPVRTVLERVSISLIYRQGSKKGIAGLVDRLREPYALDQPPLLRAGLLKISGDKYFLAFANHHIISDGVTEAVLMDEISRIYQGQRLLPARPYRDYVAWEQRQWGAGYYRQQEQFWLSHLKDEVPVLQLPYDHPRPAQVTFDGGMVTVEADAMLAASLKALAGDQHTTLFVVLYCAYTVLLHKYTDQEDIIVGVPMANRMHPELQDMLGMFVNMVPWRTAPAAEKYFTLYLREVIEAAAHIYQYQSYPFEQLVKQLQLKKDPSRNPLFDTIFVLQQTGIPLLAINGLHVSPYVIQDNATKVDLTVEIFELEGRLRCCFKYNTQLFEELTIHRMAGHYVQLLSAIVSYPHHKLSALDMLTTGERQQLLDFNPVATSFPGDQSLYQLLLAQVARAPEQVAVQFDDSALTYQQLHEKASHYAGQLIASGARAGTKVALLTDRSLEMIIAIWAVLRIGGTYVPIDPDYPEERILFLLEDSGATIYMTTYAIYPYINWSFEGKRLIVSSDVNILPAELPLLQAPAAPAYIMYTSGSTGSPKGIAVAHHNVIRTVMHTNYVTIYPEDHLLQVSNYAFDGSVFDIFGALLNGATLVLIRQEAIIDIEQLDTVIREKRISVMFVTTALFNACVQTYPQCFLPLRKLLFGGEQVSPAHVNMAIACLGTDKLIHVYGPTENTVFSTAYAINGSAYKDHVPIGVPLSNTRAYVLSRSNMLHPVGVPGELYLGGAGVSDGYWNKPALTAERFVRHALEEGLLYRTGDIVKWNGDGQLVFVRRADQQVKIRGFRIEPGETEQQLSLHADVDQCAVIVHIYADTQDKRLCAFYTSKEALDADTLKEYLSRKVPFYMIPDIFLQLPLLPLTSNGKVDKKELGAMLSADGETIQLQRLQTYVPAETPNEKAVAAVWCDVFGLVDVGKQDNFYTLGGHSLKALQVVNLLQQQGYLITVNDLFSYPTVEELAANIAVHKGRLPIKKREKSRNSGAAAGMFPLSAVQRRFFQRPLINRNIFNSPFLVLLKTYVAPAVIRTAMQEILKAHVILTVHFKQQADGEWEQCTGDFSPADYFLQTDLGSIPVTQHEATVTAHCAALQGQFSLTTGPLLRVLLFDNYLEPGQQALFFLFHHLIFDGISWQVLMDELRRRCLPFSGADNGHSSITYRDWCLRLEQYARSGKFKTANTYWRQLRKKGAASFIPDLLPGRQPLQKEMTYFIADILKDEAEVVYLQQAVGHYKGNVFNLLLTAFYCACEELQGSKAMSLYVMTAQRESFFPHIDISDTVGFFAGAYPIHLAYNGSAIEYEKIIQMVKNTLLRVPKGGLDYFVLKHMPPHAEAHKGADMEYPILFHYLNLPAAEEGTDFYTPLQLPVGITHDMNNPSAYLINITATMSPHGVKLTFYFSQAHFYEKTITALAAAFQRHLQHIIHPQK
ncbi:non-ribosomal peptide synthetase [Chitinophaga pendula]|uniref:non-ribosomal peptide synthetase n=1 Tax=Chitinophaga TaxID=79328 RepID=UPI000BAF9D65|nr:MULTISPECIES: non-ribosomal peptide synthetase [Chitinophaga]ASZ13246.1 hypothetical protein CK934_20905 [Chitinophaga sp. MD30]UCJ09134.1 non-ribosomal peptide synthetase [Chitinophaga pendula]